jgi:pimeloyl-ACP methyl ester carboxylesterase
VTIVEDKWVDAGGLRLSYVEWRPSAPPSGPTLLLLHGMSSNALFWLRVARHLQSRRVLAIDLRGHGRSDRPAAGYTAAVMAVDIGRAIEALELGPVVIGGHSWGAAVGLELCANRPDVASALVLIDGPTASLADCMTLELADTQMRPPAPCYVDLVEAERDQARFLGDAWRDDLRDFVHRSYHRQADCWRPVLPEPGREQMVRALYELRPEALLAKLNIPVLVIAASDDTDGVAPDVLGWWRARAEAAASLCRAGRAIHYTSRHDIPLIRPEALAADLAGVSTRVAGSD